MMNNGVLSFAVLTTVWRLSSGFQYTPETGPGAAEQCKFPAGVAATGYARGSCYFRTSTTVTPDQIQAHCDQHWSGAFGAVLPDLSVVQQLFAQMTCSLSNCWLFASGVQANETDGRYANWYWRQPNGRRIPISKAEFEARAHANYVSSQPGGVDYDWLILQGADGFKFGDKTLQSGPRVLCQKRLHAINYASFASKRGQGARLGPPASVSSNFACSIKCLNNAACLSFSYKLSTNECQLHYTTQWDAKLKVIEDMWGGADYIWSEVTD